MDTRTRILHCGQTHDPVTGASSVPIYQASTFHQPDVEHPGEWDYTRSGNPTRAALEKAIAELEGGASGYAFASGIAAISAAFMMFRPGDHLVVPEDLYGGTSRLLRDFFPRWGLESTFVDMSEPENIRAAITPATKAIYVETPSNPLLKITDLRAAANIAREHGILSMIDNTFCTPYLQRPIDFGFDIVLHSGTKFLNGHSDVLAGLAVARTPEIGKRIRFIQNALGAVLGVQDSWLLLRGLRTLSVRMDAAQKNAVIIAEALRTLSGVTKVYYPGLSDHPGHAVNVAQSSGPGAVLSFELESGELARAFLRSVTLPFVGVSLGGVESLLSYPVTMSHAAMPERERLRLGITDRLIRLSVGLECPEDLLADFGRALASCKP